MTRVVDVWRAVDPEARLISGSVDELSRPVRGVLRTRAAPPHLPPSLDGQLLIVDAALAAGGLDHLQRTLRSAGLLPPAIIVAGRVPAGVEATDAPLPVLASQRAAGPLLDAAAGYLADEPARLATLAADLRLAGAEAALADPDPGSATGLVAARIGRGAAVLVDGRLRSLNPRPAGRALAARFAAAVGRGLTAGSGRAASARRSADGLWLLERRVRPGAAVWLFDDLPFAAVDEVAIGALAVTLRALLRRPAKLTTARPTPAPIPPEAGDRLRATLLAVARANGRIAPAARELGVHRNTVLYRLRNARRSLGIDPRRPGDALRLLADAERGARRRPAE